jgi:hypothetical protein
MLEVMPTEVEKGFAFEGWRTGDKILLSLLPSYCGTSKLKSVVGKSSRGELGTSTVQTKKLRPVA